MRPAVVALMACALLVVGVTAKSPEPVPVASTAPVVAAAGDIACSPTDPNFNGGNGRPGKCHMKATSDLVLAMRPARVLMLGDAQYNSGRLADFNASYALSWGRFKASTHPAVGNHEYGTSGAAGYFSYFGDAATPREPGCRANCQGYYSFNIGNWHVAVLNTECTRVPGGCGAGSPQDRWLERDLAANPRFCTLVVGHKPRWASNSAASTAIAPLVEDMDNAGVDVFLAGHSHTYERFAPQRPVGTARRRQGHPPVRGGHRRGVLHRLQHHPAEQPGAQVADLRRAEADASREQL